MMPGNQPTQVTSDDREQKQRSDGQAGSLVRGGSGVTTNAGGLSGGAEMPVGPMGVGEETSAGVIVRTGTTDSSFFTV